MQPPLALQRFEFLHWFDGRVVSGEEKTRKPFKDIYEKLIRRFSIIPAESIYIDDNLRNLDPAKALGFHTVHFQDPAQFAKTLTQAGLL